MSKNIIRDFEEDERVELLEIAVRALEDSRVLRTIGNYLDLSDQYLEELREKAREALRENSNG